MNVSETINEFILKIEFEKGSQHPSRVFNAMAEMIDAFYELDKCLAKSFAVEIEPILILQDIETGSIKTKLASMLKTLDDDALKELSWQKAVGSFLVKGKHKVLKFLEANKEISSTEQINELGNGLLQLAQETNIQQIPLYSTIPQKNLLDCISSITKSSSILSENDQAKLISTEGEVSLNPKFQISSETIEELLTKHTICDQLEILFLIKKPDYLGQSMWDVQYRGRTVQAKILDVNWLRKFHNREINLFPGDSLKAFTHIEIKFGENNAIVGEHYTIIKVIDVIKHTTSEQNRFL